ncbi:MAG: EamA family transporter [Actinomycetota bacterium]
MIQRFEKANRRRGTGFAAIFVASTLLGVGQGVARILLDRGIDTVELVQVRYWMAALILGVILTIKGWTVPDGPSTRRGASVWVVVFGISIAVSNAAYYRALQSLPIGIAATILYTAPAMLVLWKWLVQGIRPNLPVTVGVLVAFAGVLLLSELQSVLGGASQRLDPVGVLAALGGALGLAIMWMSGKQVAAVIDPARGFLAASFVAAFLLSAWQVSRGWPTSILRWDAIPGILYLGTFATVIPFILLLWGLRQVDTRQAGIIAMVEAFVAALFGYVWLNQSLTAFQILGGGLIVLGGATVRAGGADEAGDLPKA